MNRTKSPLKRENLVFEQVKPTKIQIDILYQLLGERQHFISHKGSISFAQHEKFVKNMPYRAWFLVKDNGFYKGSFYITDTNTIGINLKKGCYAELLASILEFVEGNFKPLNEVPSVRVAGFFINVPTNNLELMELLQNKYSHPIQYTFKIT